MTDPEGSEELEFLDTEELPPKTPVPTVNIDMDYAEGGAPNAPLVRIGHEVYPWPFHPQCHVCSSPYRMFIEKQNLLGTNYRSIAALVAQMAEEGEATPNSRSIEVHFRRVHSPVPQHVRSAIIQAEAEAQGIDRTIQDLHVTPRLLTQIIMRDGYEKLLTGEISVDDRLLIQAATLSAKMESETAEAGLTKDLFMEATMRMMTIIQDRYGDEEARAIARTFQEDPILSGLLRRAQSSGVMA